MYRNTKVQILCTETQKYTYYAQKHKSIRSQLHIHVLRLSIAEVGMTTLGFRLFIASLIIQTLFELTERGSITR